MKGCGQKPQKGKGAAGRPTTLDTREKKKYRVKRRGGEEWGVES